MEAEDDITFWFKVCYRVSREGAREFGYRVRLSDGTVLQLKPTPNCAWVAEKINPGQHRLEELPLAQLHELVS